jgi:predicted phage-related endonuclease
MATLVFPADPEVLLGPDPVHDEWLAMRQRGVGGSEVGSLIGSNKYATAIDVYNEKALNIRPEFTPAQLERMESGNRMEKAIVEWGADKLRLTVEHDSIPGLMCDRDHSWRRASIDGLGFAGDSPAAVLEAKNVGSYHTEGSLVAQYRDQVLWYCGVLGVHHGYLLALVGGQDLLTIPIEWDGLRFEQLCSVVDRFWHEHVQIEVPPTFEDFPPHVSLVAERYQGDTDVTSPTFTDAEGDEFLTLAARHKDLKKRARTLDSEIGEVEASIKMKMGDSEVAYVSGNLIAKWAVVHSTKVDRKKLEADFPKAAEAVIGPSVYRRFSIAAKSIRLEEVS